MKFRNSNDNQPKGLFIIQMSKKIDHHILEMYKIGDLVGSGAYGHVWKAQDKRSQQLVALKKVFGAFRNNIDAQRTYRQVQILQKLSHPNIIKLYKVIGASNKLDLYLVFQLMQADLLAVVGSGILTINHQKYILFQILKGIAYLHQLKLLHRDLKPSNVLLDSNCKVKICDFGLVRSLTTIQEEHPILSEQVATKWYRSPELLLGSRSYSYPADIWSVGCITAELLTGKPLFQGKSVIEQLQKIIQFSGAPSKQDLESLDSPVVQCLVGQINPRKKSFSEYFSLVNPQFYPLLKGLLKFNPFKRLTAQQALGLEIFRQFKEEKQQPFIKEVVPQLNDNHRFDVNEYRRQIYSSIPKKLHAPIQETSFKKIKFLSKMSKQNATKNEQHKVQIKQTKCNTKIRVKSSPVQKKIEPKKQVIHKTLDKYKSVKLSQSKFEKSPYASQINIIQNKKRNVDKHVDKFKKKNVESKTTLKKVKKESKRFI